MNGPVGPKVFFRATKLLVDFVKLFYEISNKGAAQKYIIIIEIESIKLLSKNETYTLYIYEWNVFLK